MHPASISAREHHASASKLKIAFSMDPIVDSRLRYNAAELRGILGHVAVQTENSGLMMQKVVYDVSTQAVSDEDVLASSEERFERLLQQFSVERERMYDRERLLIAQMNALRDLHAQENLNPNVYAELKITVNKIEFDLSILPRGYDVLELMISVVLAGRRDRVLAQGGPMILTISSTKSVNVIRSPLSIPISEQVGQISLLFDFKVSSKNHELYPLVLGEWVSPPFIPNLRERGEITSMLAVIDRVGLANIELLVN
jgi:hypothetical protein